jgi:hypothetical protein
MGVVFDLRVEGLELGPADGAGLVKDPVIGMLVPFREHVVSASSPKVWRLKGHEAVGSGRFHQKPTWSDEVAKRRFHQKPTWSDPTSDGVRSRRV